MRALVTGNAPTLMQAVVEALEADVILGADMRAASHTLGGALDLLICVTAPSGPDRIADLTATGWDTAQAALRDAAFLSQEFAAQAPQGSQIIHVIDQPPQVATAQFTSAAIAAEGLRALTRISARQLAPKVRVNAIAPARHASQIRGGPREADLAAQDRQLGLPPQSLRATLAYVIGATAMTGETMTLQPSQGGSGIVR